MTKQHVKNSMASTYTVSRNSLNSNEWEAQFAIHKRFSCSFVSLTLSNISVHYADAFKCKFRDDENKFFLQFIVDSFFFEWQESKKCVYTIVSWLERHSICCRVLIWKNYYSDHLEYWKEFLDEDGIYWLGSKSYETFWTEMDTELAWFCDVLIL